VHEQRDAEGSNLEPLMRWMEENAHRELTLDDVATRATMSSRTLNRRFREQTGTTPLQWLRRFRIRRAQYLLETTGHSVERIALQVGFGSPMASATVSSGWSAPALTPTGVRSRVRRLLERTVRPADPELPAGLRQRLTTRSQSPARVQESVGFKIGNGGVGIPDNRASGRVALPTRHTDTSCLVNKRVGKDKHERRKRQ
jgi:AraC-like DNA-binding protein